MIKVGVIGAAGYTGGEVMRLLFLHPMVELVLAQSESQVGKKVYEVHPDLFPHTEINFEKELRTDVDVLFLCKGHSEAKSFLKQRDISSSVKIIDLSQDFRHEENRVFEDRTFVYGLPELNKKKITKTNSIANPGCFATAIQLALLPLAQTGAIKGAIHVSAVTGSTGAGQSFSSTNHFSWRSQNHSVYKALEHQHEQEITESLKSIQTEFCSKFFFIPQRGAFTRGIYAVCYVEAEHSLEEYKKQYDSYYQSHPFTHLVPFDPDVKQVVNTNYCFISLQQKKGQLIISSVIDNMLKGAAGQAIQNMNLMFGLEEKTGLRLKSSAF